MVLKRAILLINYQDADSLNGPGLLSNKTCGLKNKYVT